MEFDIDIIKEILDECESSHNKIKIVDLDFDKGDDVKLSQCKKLISKGFLNAVEGDDSFAEPTEFYKVSLTPKGQCLRDKIMNNASHKEIVEKLNF